MFDKLCDNLNFLMKEMSISADELSRRTNLPASTIKKIRSRYNPNPTLTTLIPLANFFALTLGQLVGSEPLPPTRHKGEYKLDTQLFKHVPLITWKEVLTWPETIRNQHSTVTTEFQYDQNAFALVVEEENWENLTKNTVLLVEPSTTPEHRDFFIVHKQDQPTASLKQILIEEGRMYLKSAATGYGIVPATSNYRFIGRVTEYKKSLKKEKPSTTMTEKQ